MDPYTLGIAGFALWAFCNEVFASPEEKARREAKEKEQAEQKRLKQQQKVDARAALNAERERTRRRQNRHQNIADLQRELDGRLAACRIIQDADLRLSMEALARREHATQ